METRRSIKRLDPSVFERIAAGEVVKRPASAIKEMIENSLDAKATSIQVVVKDGGMKYLQVQDNGIGIKKEDLEIICERYTTSKLQNFEELHSVNTYGFRGEALSSISQVAHLSITTKMPEERCGYHVSYMEGKTKGKPVPCGTNQGTLITVENMFYNVPVRQKMLKNFHEEFKRIWNVVARYAIHNVSVGFSLKKYGQKEMSIKTLPNSTTRDNVRCLFNAEISQNLLEKEGYDETLHFKFHIFATNLNYSSPQMIFILFINHRFVKAQDLQKKVTELYNVYLPRGTHPFIYINLEMAPENVDVNVHPTKENIFYLHEESINKKVTAVVQQLVFGKDAFQTYQEEAVSLSQAETLCGSEEPVATDNECQVRKETENATNSKSTKIHVEHTEKQIANPNDKASVWPGNMGSVADVCLNTLDHTRNSAYKTTGPVDEPNMAITSKTHSQDSNMDVTGEKLDTENITNGADECEVLLKNDHSLNKVTALKPVEVEVRKTMKLGNFFERISKPADKSSKTVSNSEVAFDDNCTSLSADKSIHRPHAERKSNTSMSFSKLDSFFLPLFESTQNSASETVPLNKLPPSEVDNDDKYTHEKSGTDVESALISECTDNDSHASTTRMHPQLKESKQINPALQNLSTVKTEER